MTTTIALPAAPISPLRQRLIEDMTMRRFTRETQRNYVRDVGRFATFLGRPPDTATADDLRRFQVEQRDSGVSVPTMNSIVSALRFFFTHTLDRPDLARKLVRLTHPRKLPVVLSRDEVARLLNATTCLKHQAALSVAYGAGLRVGGEPPLSLPLLGGRIAPFEPGGKDLLGLGASAVEGHAAIRADRVFTQPRTGAAGAVEGDEDLLALGRHLHAESRQGFVPVDDVLGRRLQPIYGAFGEADSRHWAPQLQPGTQIGSTLQAALSLPVNLHPRIIEATRTLSHLRGPPGLYGNNALWNLAGEGGP